MKKLSLLLAVLCCISLFGCQKAEPEASDGTTPQNVTEALTPTPPIEEALRGTVKDGTLYLADGYTKMSVPAWTLKMAYEYSTRLVNDETGDMLTVGIIHDPESHDTYESNSEEAVKERFSTAFPTAELLSFSKDTYGGHNRVCSTFKITEAEVDSEFITSYMVYEIRYFINTDIYTLSYYIYSDSFTADDVQAGADSFEYLG